MDPVVIYTTQTCFYCKIAKNFFTQNGIPFEERDVSKNPEFIKDIEEKSHQRSVPMIEIGDEIFIGFDRPAIAHTLKLENKK